MPENLNKEAYSWDLGDSLWCLLFLTIISNSKSELKTTSTNKKQKESLKIQIFRKNHDQLRSWLLEKETWNMQWKKASVATATALCWAIECVWQQFPIVCSMLGLCMQILTVSFFSLPFTCYLTCFTEG